MPPELTPGVVTDDPEAPKWAIRLEAKVDLALAGQSAEIQEAKALARDAQRDADQARAEAREARDGLILRPTWHALWSVVGALAGALLAYTTFLQPYLHFQ